MNNNIKVYRLKEKGLSQAKLAQRAGIALRHYQNLEYGLARPRIDTLHRLAKALGVTEAELFPLPDDAAGD